LLWACVPASSSRGQWTSVGDGIDYKKLTITMADGKANNLFVARMAASNTNCIINGMIAQNHVSGAVETVPSQAARYEEAINFWGKSWGQRNDVIVAVNGSFFDIGGTDIITGGQAYDGWYAKRFDYGAQTGFAWKFDRSYFIADCVKTVDGDQTVAIGTASRNYQGMNTARASDDLIVYTPQYNNNTLTDNSGTEVLVEMNSPLLMLESPSGSYGTIRQVRVGQGSTLIPFDHVVLSGVGTAATFLQNNAHVGDTVRITADADHYDITCKNEATSLANTYGLTQGYFVFLRNGAVVPTSNSGMIIRNPRTFVAHNANHVFFCVCDGRSTKSAGMTSDEMGWFCKTNLAATDGLNQDGGGSSTMWVNGVVKNDPSDGSPRAVANGIMMVNLLPKQTSTVFVGGHPVTTTASANMRLGPGTDYYAFTSIAKSTQGLVLDHHLNGVYAKGYYWWKCSFSGTTGWIAESLLQALPSPPLITQQPSNRDIVEGGTTSFTVGVAGLGPFACRWQRNNVDLDNGGHYSGVTTNTLTVSSADASDVASYRCVVTNAYGSTNSSSATLTLLPATPCVGMVNADFEGTFNVAGGGYIADNWTEWEDSPGVTIGYDETAIVHGGGHSQRVRVWGTNATSGGVYQRIPITIGQEFNVSAWVYAGDDSTVCWLGVDPAGGIPQGGPGSGVIWSAGSTNVAWVQKTVTGNAAASYITVYLKVESPDSAKRNGYFDDATPAISNSAIYLTAQIADNALVVTWPECPPAQLMRADTLADPIDWTAVINEGIVIGGQRTVTLTPANSAGFFRLVAE